MTSTNFSSLLPSILAIAALGCPPFCFGQGSGILTVAPPPKVTVKRNSTADVKITVQLRNGYHVNSNMPAEDYLIPLRLEWGAGPMKAASVVYPKPEQEKYEFSEKPISVFTGNFDIVTKFRVPADAPVGFGGLVGKLRYQACNQNACFPPKTVEVRLAYDVR